MKTGIIIAIIAIIAVYSLRSIIKHFKGEDDCCGGGGCCSGGGECHCHDNDNKDHK